VEVVSLTYRDLLFEKGVATVNLAGGVMTAKLDGLQAADGTVSADATLDASQPVAALVYHATAAGVQARPMMTSLTGNDRLSGTADFEASGEARGRNQKELVESLNGDGQFKFLDGAIHGINLAATLRNAKTLGFGGSGDAAEKTDFAELSGTYTIKNGVLENSDFKMLAPLLRLKGEGLVPMPPREVDYDVEATLVATLEGQSGKEGLTGLPIPISITGPWEKPSYSVDWARVFQEAALDPERLKNMPDDLRDLGKDLGVDLAIPGVEEGSLGDALKAVPGLSGDSKSGEEAATSSEGSLDVLKQLAPKSEEPAAEVGGGQAQEPAPAPEDSLKKGLKGLFGN
jgi:AsmA protein